MYSLGERMRHITDAVSEMSSAEQFGAHLKEITLGAVLEPVRSARHRWMNFFGYKGLKPGKPLVYGNAEYLLKELGINEVGRKYMRLIGERKRNDPDTDTEITEHFVTPRIPLSRGMFVVERDPEAERARELARERRAEFAEDLGNAVGRGLVHTPLAALFMLAYSAGAPMQTPYSSGVPQTGFHNGASLEVSDAIPNGNELTTSNEQVTDSDGTTRYLSWEEYFERSPFSPDSPNLSKVAVTPEDIRLGSGAIAIGGALELESIEPQGSVETDRTH